VLQQPGINSAVVSTRNQEQLMQDVEALNGEIPDSIFERLTAINAQAMKHIPNTDNMYRYYP
jgi:aryl-alcohol dehydrogenase-like predicted oxidoreductase